jgi:DNA replication licensing factor MCM2
VTLNFNDNVDLTAPILSRFDLLAVVKDEVDEDYDDALATFVINSHMKNHPSIMSEMRKIDGNDGLDDNEKTQAFDTIQARLDDMVLPNNRMNQEHIDIIE